MSEDHPRERTHHDCKCPECDPMVAMADRTTAWKNANSLLQGTNWPEGDQPTVHDTMALADWLLYGPGDNED